MPESVGIQTLSRYLKGEYKPDQYNNRQGFGPGGM